MQKFLLFLVLAGLGFLVYASMNNNPPEVTKDLEQARTKAVAYFISDQEAPILDAVWAKNDIFKVAVIDDSTNRDGLASYVCSKLYEHGFNGEKVRVSVIDIVKLKQKNKWVEIGKASCA